jgi:hypothetical protein
MKTQTLKWFRFIGFFCIIWGTIGLLFALLDISASSYTTGVNPRIEELDIPQILVYFEHISSYVRALVNIIYLTAGIIFLLRKRFAIGNKSIS